MSEDPSPQPPLNPDRGSLVLFAVLVEGGLIGLACLLGWGMGHPPLPLFHWSLESVALGAAASGPMLLLLLLLLKWPVGPLRGIKKLTVGMIGSLMKPCTNLDLFGISVLAGLGEEMLFRGALQPFTSQWLGSPWLGLVVVSIGFGLGHSLSWTYAVLATLMGLYLGWLQMVSDNLVIPSVAHALYDFVALIVIVRLLAPPQRETEAN